MSSVLSIALGVMAVLAALAGIGWLGFQVKPRPFPPRQGAGPGPGTASLSPGLPAPVRRFFEAAAGPEVPLARTAYTAGRARMRPFGLWVAARYEFTYIAGQAYHHRIEVCWFGLPIMKIDERYQDGRAVMRLPFGTVEGKPQIDEAAERGLWAETIWLPPLYAADPGLRWEAVDDTTARLVAPYQGDEHRYTLCFDPDTGLLSDLRTMRYRDAHSTARMGWGGAALGWRTLGGMRVPDRLTTEWEDQGGPWVIWDIEQVAYNVDVSDRLPGAAGQGIG